MLTVLMTTYNGASTLPNTLETFCQLDSPKGGWKLVIVNNGSTDQTQEIIKSYLQRLPITLLFEPIQGKNVALNTGLSSVTGDLIVFTDDDVLPQPDWLVQIRAVADSHLSVSIFGGNILPKWENSPPPWISNLEWPYRGVTFALIDPTLREGPVGPDYIVGPNMAVRSELFKAGHRFDVTIGPNGSDIYPMGSETEFIARMNKLGYKLWYSKRPVVYHIIRAYQMDQEWALRRAIRFGRGKYRVWAKHSLDSPILSRIPRYFIRQAITRIQILIQSIRLARARQQDDNEKIFREHWLLNYYRGKAIEGQTMGVERQFATSPDSFRE